MISVGLRLRGEYTPNPVTIVDCKFIENDEPLTHLSWALPHEPNDLAKIRNEHGDIDLADQLMAAATTVSLERRNLQTGILLYSYQPLDYKSVAKVLDEVCDFVNGQLGLRMARQGLARLG